MNIRKYIRDVISENYPLGAANDPNAPWNDNTKYSTPEEPENSVFDVIAMNRDMAILKDSSGKKYFFYYEHLDRSELSDYAEREVVDAYRDEDGDMSIDYSDDWEIDENVIDRYVNDNISSLKVGKGFDDYESGNFDVIEIDGPLKQELIRMYGTPDKYTNEREAAIIQKSLEGIGGGETTDLSEGVKDKEPFGKVIFGVDLSTVGESERVHLIQLIKKYKGEGIKTDTSGSWATYVPIDDVEDFVSDARKFKPSSTGETEQFSKFKNRLKVLLACLI